jgi:hypothetical protein
LWTTYISNIWDLSTDIYIDQTTLTIRAAKKLLHTLDDMVGIGGKQIEFVVLECDIDKAIGFNSLREGVSYVPENVVRRMYESFRMDKVTQEKIDALGFANKITVREVEV